MLWSVVKIRRALAVEQTFVLERHKQASARVRVPLARIALPLQPVTFTVPVGQGQQLSFAPFYFKYNRFLPRFGGCPFIIHFLSIIPSP